MVPRLLTALLLCGLAASLLPAPASAACVADPQNRGSDLTCAVLDAVAYAPGHSQDLAGCLLNEQPITQWTTCTKEFNRAEVAPVTQAAVLAVLCPLNEGSIAYCYLQ